MLNVSQAAEISYNVGTMPRNIGSLDAGLKKEKATGAKDRGRKGSWRTMRKKKAKATGFIPLLLASSHCTAQCTLIG